MTTYTRIALIHATRVALLAACAVALNVIAWSTVPDPFPDTLWNLLFMPSFRVVAGIGGVISVVSCARDRLTLRLLRMHRRRAALGLK